MDPRRDQQAFWCHNCNHSVRLTDPHVFICHCCGEGFLEEIPTLLVPPPSDPHPHARRFGGAATAGGAVAVGGLGAAEPNWAQLTDMIASMMRRSGGQQVSQSPYSGMVFVRGNRGGSEDTWRVVNAGRTEGGDLSVNVNDFERLVQQLLEGGAAVAGDAAAAAAAGNYGTPPATMAAIEGMARVRITREHLAGDNSGCAVCKDDFAVGTEVRQMPCSHLYHQDCIVPWLTIHGSCPVCRYEVGGGAAAAEPPRPSSSVLPSWLFRRRS